MKTSNEKIIITILIIACIWLYIYKPTSPDNNDFKREIDSLESVIAKNHSLIDSLANTNSKDIDTVIVKIKDIKYIKTQVYENMLSDTIGSGIWSKLSDLNP